MNVEQTCDEITYYFVNGQSADAATYAQAQAAIDARHAAVGITDIVTCAYCGKTVPVEQAALWLHVTIPVISETTAPHNKWFHRLDCLVNYYTYQRGKFTREPLPPITIPAEVGGLTREWSRRLQERLDIREAAR